MKNMVAAVTENSISSVREWRVGAEEAGQRLDNFLLRVLKGVPRSHIYKILRSGEVRVNRGRSRPSYHLSEGDVLRLPPVRTAPAAETGAVPPGLAAALEGAVLFEDDHILIVNKPAGLAVHGGSGLAFGLIESMRQLRPGLRTLELVHRLDKDTSGCLILAKKRSALRALHEAFRAGAVDKHYLVLVRGHWQGRARTVVARLRKNILQSGERVVRVDEAGKEARTTFVPERRFAQATLLRAELDTGRTHQIRVHLQSLGYPVAGDEKYGDPDFNRTMRALGLRRLFLHAAQLNFMHPQKGERVAVKAPLPDDLANVLTRLEEMA